MSPGVIIETENLRKVYGMGDYQVRALDGVDISIESGEFVAVMGQSGSGKSTLMNILGCLDRPTEGRYVLAGIEVGNMNKAQLAAIRNRKIGFVFQSYNLLPRLTAARNVMVPLLYNGSHGRTDAERYQRAVEMLESVGLGDRTHHRPNELSGGQQQRVAIARALVNEPSILLADEPTGNLDTRSGEDIMALLDELSAEGATIVMVTHELNIAEHAQRAIYLLDGEIVSDRLHASGLSDLHAQANGSEEQSR